MYLTVERWIDLLLPWHQTRLVERVGGEVARQCRDDLWRRVSRHLSGMSAAEVRGYARAHAIEIVAAETDWALHRHRLSANYRARVIESGIEQIVAMVVRDALRMAPTEVDARPIAA
jgi:hypothetical protein